MGTVVNSTASIFKTGASSGASIGGPVSGGTPNEVLFIDGSGNLAQDPTFLFDSGTLLLTAPQMVIGNPPAFALPADQLEVTGIISSFPVTSGGTAGFSAFVLGNAFAANFEALQMFATSGPFQVAANVGGTGTQHDLFVGLGGPGFPTGFIYFAAAGSGRVGVGTDNPVTEFVVSRNDNEGMEVNLLGPNVIVTAFNRTTALPIPLFLNGSTVTLQNNPGGDVLTIAASGDVGIGTAAPTSKLQVVGLPIFLNNAAAVGGGLTPGAFYRTGADPDLVAVVH
jgi:hypothetical protein